MRFNIATDDQGKKSVTAILSNGTVLVADGQHPNYADIIDNLLNKTPTDSEVQGLFDVSFVLGQQFERVGGDESRLTVSKGRIFLDHEEVEDDITKAILQFFTNGSKDLTGLVAFFHKQLANPNPECVKFLYGWLKKGSWSICDDGDFIGYKNVEKGTYLSWFQGEAIVDGVLVQGHIPNQPGSIVEMPRKDVEYNPRQPCTNGLHVGTFLFAQEFNHSGVLVKVKVNPMNVVSVPTEAPGQDKMRVCKYVVLDETEKENESRHEPVAVLVAHPAASNDDAFARFVDFKASDFEKLTRMELRPIGKAWGVGNVRTSKADMVTLLTKEAKKRRKGSK